MFDFRRITLFCLEKRLSKHKMTVFSENFGGGMDSLPPPGYDYVSIGRVCVQFTDTECYAVAPLGQDRSPQLPR